MHHHWHLHIILSAYSQQFAFTLCWVPASDACAWLQELWQLRGYALFAVAAGVAGGWFFVHHHWHLHIMLGASSQQLILFLATPSHPVCWHAGVSAAAGLCAVCGRSGDCRGLVHRAPPLAPAHHAGCLVPAAPLRRAHSWLGPGSHSAGPGSLWSTKTPHSCCWHCPGALHQAKSAAAIGKAQLKLWCRPGAGSHPAGLGSLRSTQAPHCCRWHSPGALQASPTTAV